MYNDFENNKSDKVGQLFSNLNLPTPVLASGDKTTWNSITFELILIQNRL